MSREPKSIAPARRRCAIYTRKSSDEGLDQAFNSLHAQREACEAYVLSQAGEGWAALPKIYDDGGFSGGTMERPALKALLADIEHGLIDIVVVYKVDRLTRALADFARIVDAFDKRGVSFVSVTQAFNTTTSMGRLTLNVLLSFAQFEREVTGERIRDKIAASKAKGMWMGGGVPLGYDAKDRTLVVNQAEAEQVKAIFQRYLELGSVHMLKAELDAQGVRSKAWRNARDESKGDQPFSRGALFHLLKNPTYAGLIPHKDVTYPGLHAAIIDPDTFDTVQKLLAANSRKRRERPTRAAASPLVGLVFDVAGGPMSPAFAYGKSKRVYRYYVSSDRQRGQGNAAVEISRISAPALENLVFERLERVWPCGLDQDALCARLNRVEVHPGALHLLARMDEGAGAQSALAHLSARLDPRDHVALEPDAEVVRIVVAMRPVFRGGRTWLLAPGGASATDKHRLDPNLIRLLQAAHASQIDLRASPMTPPDELYHARSASDSYVRKHVPLAFLAPDIQRAIFEGRQPPGLTAQQILSRPVPAAWADQRALYGF